MVFHAVYVSAANDRVSVQNVDARDIDNAAEVAIDSIERFFGARAAWFVAGVVQEEHAEMVFSTLEAMVRP